MAIVQNIVVLDDDGNTLPKGLFGNGSGDTYYVNTSTPRIVAAGGSGDPFFTPHFT